VLPRMRYTESKSGFLHDVCTYVRSATSQMLCPIVLKFGINIRYFFKDFRYLNQGLLMGN